NRPEVPHLLAGFRVVGADAAANRELAAREPRADLAVVAEGRRRDAVAFCRIRGEHVPDDGAGLLIEGDEPPVEAAEKDHAVAHPEAPAQPAAADDGVLEVDVPFVSPEELAGLDVYGEHVVIAGHDVDDAL